MKSKVNLIFDEIFNSAPIPKFVLENSRQMNHVEIYLQNDIPF